jgi:hypothetical protein
MSLDISRLQKVKKRGSNIVARCPACAENGADKKGEHLFIRNGGQFGCVLYPSSAGHQHRQRIFELAGDKEKSSNYITSSRSAFPTSMETSDQPRKFITVNKPSITNGPPKVLQKDILGHLGHLFPTLCVEKHKNKPSIDIATNTKDSAIPVPNVPQRHWVQTTDSILEEQVMTDAEKYRLMQAEALLIEAGYVKLPNGSWVKPLN